MPSVTKQALCPDICGSKVILFLGAGASAPLGLPLMDSFMDVLEGQMNRKFLPIVRRMFEMPGKSRDLEILFETLDEYDKIARHLRNDGNWSGIVGRSQAQGVDDLTGAVDKIRRLAAMAVLQEYSNVEEPQVLQLYHDFVSLFVDSNTERHVPIFTTNYDLAIETLADVGYRSFDLVDGFTSDNVRRWDPSIFHQHRATPPYEPTILLFKLHGSCNWRLNKQARVVTKESTAELVSPDSTYDNALMWPAETKTVKEGPYEVNYAYLKQCLMGAELCVVIGFSFRDQVILDHFTHALAANQHLRIAVIDPSAEAIASRKLGAEDFARVKPIVARFEVGQLTPITFELSKISFPWAPGNLVGLTAQPD